MIGRRKWMKIRRKTYKSHAKSRASRSPVAKNCFAAFWTGGLICAAGQLISELYGWLGADVREASTYTSVTVIFIAALLTGLGVFDRAARYAGAGTLVPVTGFANSVVSPAIDNRAEGLVLGMGEKIFTVAGPVLLYAILSGAVYGAIYYFALLLM